MKRKDKIGLSIILIISIVLGLFPGFSVLKVYAAPIPVVTITSPLSGTYSLGSSIQISATATYTANMSATIRCVSTDVTYNLGQQSSSNYSASYTLNTNSTYVIKVSATNISGTGTATQAVTAYSPTPTPTPTPTPPPLPVVNIASPTSGTYSKGDVIHITATGTNNTTNMSGTIRTVSLSQLYNFGTRSGNSFDAYYTLNEYSSYIISIGAYNSAGSSSAQITITVPTPSATPTPSSYTLTYNGNGNTSGTAPTGGTYNVGASVSVDGQGTLLKTGCDFAGWYDNPACTGSQIYNPFTMPAKNLTLFAKWDPIYYVLTYSGNGCTGGTPPIGGTYTYGSSVTVAGQGSIVKSGCSFGGWYDNSACTGSPYTGSISMPAKNLSLYAKWNPLGGSDSITLDITKTDFYKTNPLEDGGYVFKDINASASISLAVTTSTYVTFINVVRYKFDEGNNTWVKKYTYTSKTGSMQFTNTDPDTDAGEYKLVASGTDRNGMVIADTIIFNVSVADYSSSGMRYRLYGICVNKIDSTSMTTTEVGVSQSGTLNQSDIDKLNKALPAGKNDGLVHNCSGPGIVIIYTTDPDSPKNGIKYYCDPDNHPGDKAAFAKIMGQANADEAWSNHTVDSISVPTYKLFTAFAFYNDADSNASIANMTQYFTSTNDPLITANNEVKLDAGSTFTKTFSPGPTTLQTLLNSGYTFDHVTLGNTTFTTLDINTVLKIDGVYCNGTKVADYSNNILGNVITVRYYFNPPPPLPPPTVTITQPSQTSFPVNTTINVQGTGTNCDTISCTIFCEDLNISANLGTQNGNTFSSTYKLPPAVTQTGVEIHMTGTNSVGKGYSVKTVYTTVSATPTPTSTLTPTPSPTTTPTPTPTPTPTATPTPTPTTVPTPTPTATPTPTKYTLAYDGNGNTSGVAPTGGSYTAGTLITVAGQGSLLSNRYNFGGWYNNNSGTGSQYTGSFSMPANNLTLYAKWNPSSPPVITCNPSSSAWVKYDISCNLTITDNDNDYTNCKYVWSTSTTQPSYFPYASTSSSFYDTLTTEGTSYLHVVAYDSMGNSTYTYFGPFRLDKTPPSGTYVPYSTPWGRLNVTSNFTPSDAGGSGVNRYRSRSSSDNGSSWSAWSGYTSGTVQGAIDLTSNGYNIVQSEVSDNAGNVSTIISGTYLIDKIPPTISESPSSASASPTDITVNVNVSDTLSGIDYTNYKWSTSTAKPASGWSSSLSINFSTTLSAIGTTYYLHIESFDKAGNSSYECAGPYKRVDVAPEVQSMELKMAYHKYAGSKAVPIVKDLCIPNKSDYYSVDDPSKTEGFLSSGRILAVKLVVNGNVDKVEFNLLHNTGSYQTSIKRLDKATRWFEWFSETGRSPEEPSPFCRISKSAALDNMYKNYGLSESGYSHDKYSPKPKSMSELDQNDNSYYNSSAWPLNAVNNRYEFTQQEMSKRENANGVYSNVFGTNYTNLDIRTSVDDSSGDTKIITFYYPVPYLSKQTLKTWHWLYTNTNNLVWSDIVDLKNDYKILTRIGDPYKMMVKVYNGSASTQEYRYFDVLESYVNIDKGYGSRINNMLKNKNTMKSYEISDWEVHSVNSSIPYGFVDNG